MSVAQLREALLKDIRESTASRTIPERLHVIYESSIVEEVKRALKQEIKVVRKYEQVIQRIPSINPIKQFVNKLARVYNKPAIRNALGNEKDQELIDHYVKLFGLDFKMGLANKLLELSRACALEPYMGKDGKPKLRVLANYQVRAFSANADDPLEISAITKLMGKITIPNGSPIGTPKSVNYFHTYTADEFMAWHEEGILYVQPNPIGRIPFVWLNSSEFELNPYAPESDIDTAVLVPKYYADLFYAMNYTAHSLLVGIDLAMPEAAVFDPGSILDLKTDDEGVDKGKQGRLDVVSPEIKITEALALIKAAVSDILESKGIKPPQTSDSLERPNATAALIEGADASSHILQRCNFFVSVESELWALIKHMHNNYWLKLENTIENKNQFSPNLRVDVMFGEVKPVEIRKETLENVKAQRDMNLMSKKQAMKELYPHFTDAQIEAWLAEAEKDAVQSQPATPPHSFGPGASGTSDNTQDPTEDTRGN